MGTHRGYGVLIVVRRLRLVGAILPRNFPGVSRYVHAALLLHVPRAPDPRYAAHVAGVARALAQSGAVKLSRS